MQNTSSTVSLWYFLHFEKGPPVSDRTYNPFDIILPHGAESRAAKGLDGAEIQIGSVWLQFVPSEAVTAEGIV